MLCWTYRSSCTSQHGLILNSEAHYPSFCVSYFGGLSQRVKLIIEWINKKVLLCTVRLHTLVKVKSEFNLIVMQQMTFWDSLLLARLHQQAIPHILPKRKGIQTTSTPALVVLIHTLWRWPPQNQNDGHHQTTRICHLCKSAGFRDENLELLKERRGLT